MHKTLTLVQERIPPTPQDLIRDILVSPEAAHALVRTPRGRAKRSYNVQDECCNHVSQRLCVAEEILEYCEDPVP